VTLKDIPDDQLDAEIERRKQQKRRMAEEQLEEEAQHLLDNVDAILLLMTHSRSSCSDADPCNSSYRAGRCRCNKCEVMMFKWQGEWDPNFKIQITAGYNT
jgi:hypothetical protein